MRREKNVFPCKWSLGSIRRVVGPLLTARVHSESATSARCWVATLQKEGFMIHHARIAQSKIEVELRPKSLSNK